MDSPDGIPLKFRDSVTDSHRTHSEFPGSEKICQAGHEAPVDGDHQLDDVVPGAACRGKGKELIVGKMLEIGFGLCKGDRVAESA